MVQPDSEINEVVGHVLWFVEGFIRVVSSYPEHSQESNIRPKMTWFRKKKSNKTLIPAQNS